MVSRQQASGNQHHSQPHQCFHRGLVQAAEGSCFVTTPLPQAPRIVIDQLRQKFLELEGILSSVGHGTAFGQTFEVEPNLILDAELQLWKLFTQCELAIKVGYTPAVNIPKE